jgi:CubicO group peptidase (beta-lactamase class C family)
MPWPTHEWTVSSPEAVGLDAELVRRLERDIPTIFPHLTSLLVVRHGHLVVECYYAGFGRSGFANIRSVTKSVLSALIGIALGAGYLRGLDEPLTGFFPTYVPAVRDERLHAVTIQHLLTMSAGFATDLGGDGMFDAWLQSADQVRFTLSQSLACAPGVAFHYSNLGAHLLSAILTQATGASARDFATRHLFTPLGIQGATWRTDRQGYSFGHGRLELRPRDLAKIGYLYLQRGIWEGAALISPGWVQESTRAHIAGYEWMERLPHYGYLWWVGETGGQSSFWATGHGGQALGVMPHLDLIVVMTGDAYEEPTGQRARLTERIVAATR